MFGGGDRECVPYQDRPKTLQCMKKIVATVDDNLYALISLITIDTLQL